MEKLFLMVLRMSGTAALVIAAVLLARLALDAMSASRDFALLREQVTGLARFLTACSLRCRPSRPGRGRPACTSTPGFPR